MTTTEAPPSNLPTMATASVFRGQMLANRITVTALAKQTGIERHRLSRLLSDATPLTRDQATDIATALGLNPASVLRTAETIAEVGQGRGAPTPTDPPRLTDDEVAELERVERMAQLERYIRVVNDGATPCPTDWCDDAGHHLYHDEQAPTDRNLWNSHAREHRHLIPNTVATVAAQVYENEEGITPPIVDVNLGDLELDSAEQVEEFIIALQRAAAIAFPDGPVPLLTRFCGAEDGPTLLQNRCGAEAVWMGEAR